MGVSVVNALSKHLECWIKRGGKEYNIGFKDGKIASKLEEIGTVGQRNTGTTVRFWPDPKFFDSDKFSVPQLKHTLKAKAVLCPGLRDHASRTRRPGRRTSGSTPATWATTWSRSWARTSACRRADHRHAWSGDSDAVDYALCWAPDAEHAVGESYVNLIPTIEGGTHVNGLRAGVAQAVREFCEFRNLLPRGVKLTPEDVWDRRNYVLSIKIQEPQFAGQTKERLGSRDAAPLVEGFVRDSLALWLNRHPDAGERIAQFAIDNAQERAEGRAAGGAQAHRRRPGAARQARRLRQPGSQALRAVPGRGRFGRRLGQAGARQGLPGDHAAARQDPEHLGAGPGADRRQRGSAQHQHRASASTRARPT